MQYSVSHQRKPLLWMELSSMLSMYLFQWMHAHNKSYLHAQVIINDYNIEGVLQIGRFGGDIRKSQSTLNTVNSKGQSRADCSEAHTFSLDWISRDFLRARTCRWLDTCRKEVRGGRKEGREKKKREERHWTDSE